MLLLALTYVCFHFYENTYANKQTALLHGLVQFKHYATQNANRRLQSYL